MCNKRELIERVLYEREGGSEGLFLLKTEVKRHKSGQTEKNKGKTGRKKDIGCHCCGSCVYCLATHGRFIYLALFVYSICHSRLVGWTWLVRFFLTHYIIGAKTSGYFPRGSVFLSIPLSEICVSVCRGGGEPVCLVSRVNGSFHLSL